MKSFRLLALTAAVLLSFAVAAVAAPVCSKKVNSFDFVVAGVHPRPDKALYEMLRRKWPRVLMAGDVVAPRTAMESFREGDRAGRSLQ